MAIGKILLHKFAQTPWAIDPSMFEVFTNVFNNKFEGNLLKTTKVKDDKEPLTQYEITPNGTAIIGMEGVILKKKMMMEGASGLESTLDIESSIDKALNDTNVKLIILSIDSPGGSVDGVAELSDYIYSIRGKKPIWALANGSMASAAYWIGSACDKVFCYTTSVVGSIGVYMMHVDQSKANEADGIKITYIKAGQFKTVGNPHEPLSDADKDVLQSRVNYIYDLFISAVARNRNVDKAKVQSFAEGKCYIGEQAVAVGLVDEISALGDLVYSNKYPRTGGTMFGKKNLADATIEDIKAENVKLFDEIVAGAVLESAAKISELEGKIAATEAKAKRDAAIRASALKLNQAAKGEELVASEKPLDECLSELISGVEGQSNLGKQFAATAPDSAGNAGKSEFEMNEPKTQEEAQRYCKAKYDCSDRDAWTKARMEFPKLFGGK